MSVTGVERNLFLSGVQWDKHSVLALLPLIDCKQCGWCCQLVHPIRAQEYEVERIAKHLSIAPDALKEQWRQGDDYFLSDRPCTFLRDGKCSIHPVRMVVCKYFPLVRVSRPEGEVVAVHIGHLQARDGHEWYCEAGEPVIAKLEEWQGANVKAS